MRGFLAVFEREIVERRLVVLVGLVGLAPLLLPLVLGDQPAAAREMRNAVALVVAPVVSGVLGLLLGASVLGGDLGERRLGFYFARPLAGWAIWCGKMGAAVALTATAAALALLPTWLVDAQTRQAIVPWGVFAWAVAILLVVFLAHAAGVMVRSRSPLVALDLAALAATAGAAYLIARRLLAAGAASALYVDQRRLVPIVLLAAGAAGLVQVSRGRTDLRRGHRLLSAVLWLPLALGLALFARDARWVLAVPPGEVSVFDLRLGPAGTLAYLRGWSSRGGHGYAPSFLVDLATGRYLRLSPRATVPRFSADGRRVVWLSAEGRGGGGPFEVRSLDRGGAPVARPLAFAAVPAVLALSPAGDRIATVRDGRLIVENLGDGRLVASVPVAGRVPGYGLRFAGRDRVRVYTAGGDDPPAGAEGGPETRIAELDLATGRLETTGHIAGGLAVPSLFDPAADRLLRQAGADGTASHEVLDARTGARLASLPAAPGQAIGFASFLADGRIVRETRARAGAYELAIFSPEGRELRRFALSAESWLAAVSQPAADRLVIAESAGGPGRWRTQLVEVDLATGGSRLLPADLAPIRQSFYQGSDDVWVAPLPGPASPAARLFERHGHLVWLDLPSRSVRPVFPGGAG